jgi:hypothetical protein
VETTKRDEEIEVTKLIGKLFPTVEDCFEWVAKNIKYVPEAKDYWQLPHETLQRMQGDCEDGAILLASMFLSILPKKEKWKIFIYIFETPAHALVVYNGKVYDWTNPYLNEIPSTWAFWYCFNFRNAYTTKEHVAEWKK